MILLIIMWIPSLILSFASLLETVNQNVSHLPPSLTHLTLGANFNQLADLPPLLYLKFTLFTP